MSSRTVESAAAGRSSAPTPARSTPESSPDWSGPARSSPPRSRVSRMDHEPRPPGGGTALARAIRALKDADLAPRRGRVSDLIGLIIEATGLEVEIGEVCMVGEGRDRPLVATEVVGFRSGRTLLMPLGELHGIGPGTYVNPTGAPFRVAVGEPLLGRVIDGLGNPLDGFDATTGVSWRCSEGATPDTMTRTRILDPFGPRVTAPRNLGYCWPGHSSVT